VCRFVRLDAVALNRSCLEELIEGAPAVAARVSLTSHSVTVTAPADVAASQENGPTKRLSRSYYRQFLTGTATRYRQLRG
jgi:hypothetical protein